MPRVSSKRRPIVERVADRCLFFLSKGDRCPTVRKILRGLNGEVPFGADQPRKFLAEVRRRIETIYETPVCDVLGEAMTPFIERLALRVAGLLSASKSEKGMGEED